MPRPRTKPFLLTDPAMVRALASPARQEIVDALQAAGPRTIAELAALIARPADSLYFHVRSLIKVGLVVERGERREGPGGRHVAAVFGLAAGPLVMSYDAPVRRGDVGRVVASAVRLALRDFQHGLATETVTAGPFRTVRGGRSKGWLTPAEVRRLNAIISEAQEILHAGRPRTGARCMSLGFVLAPARAKQRGGRGGRGGGGKHSENTVPDGGADGVSTGAMP